MPSRDRVGDAIWQAAAVTAPLGDCEHPVDAIGIVGPASLKANGKDLFERSKELAAGGYGVRRNDADELARLVAAVACLTAAQASSIR